MGRGDDFNISSKGRLFANLPNGAGIDRLLESPDITVDGTTVTASMIYSAKDATTSTWSAATIKGTKYGDDLSIAGSGDDVTIEETPFACNFPSVKFNEGKYFQAGNNTNGDITTEDFIIEVVGTIDSATTFMVTKSISRDGWLIGDFGSGFISFKMDDGPNSALPSCPNSVGLWFYLCVACDRSGSVQMLNNYGNNGGAVVASSVGSMSVAQPLSVGCEENGSNVLGGKIAWLALWKQANWLSGLTDSMAFAKDRFAKLIGLDDFTIGSI